MSPEELYLALLIYSRDEYKYGLDDEIDPDDTLEDYAKDPSGSFGWDTISGLFGSWWREDNDKSRDITVNGRTVDLIDHRSGGDEEGTVMWLVLKLTDATGKEQFFRKDGWYASHDGGYWEGDFYEVQPVERTVTFYEKGTGNAEG